MRAATGSSAAVRASKDHAPAARRSACDALRPTPSAPPILEPLDPADPAPRMEGPPARATPSISRPADRRARVFASQEERAQLWVKVTLLCVIAALALAVMALPGTRPTRTSIEAERVTTELQLTLTELRATIADYCASHGHYPGAGPSHRADPFWLEHELDLAFRRAESGATAFASDAPPPRAPHIESPVLENPLNHLANVHFLAATEPWPLVADDSSGWLYRPATGEIRANSPGTSAWSGTRFLDM